MAASQHPESRAGQRNPMVTPEDLQRIIVEGDTELLVDRATRIGAGLAGQLTSTQLRNVFGTVRLIEAMWTPKKDDVQQTKAARQLLLLKPKLAYQAKRQRGRGVEELERVLVPVIELVGKDYARFQRFVEFFEAIVAYHTAAGAE